MTIADCDPQISFEKEVYFPGDEVKGRAWVSTTKNLKATSVEITFSGKTITAHNGKKIIKDKKCKKGEETYVEMKHEVWTPEDTENTFPSGDYEWNFSFELPKDCPPSFEGKYGFIRYSVLLHIAVPNGKPINVERAVTVSSMVDLNAVNAHEPAKIHVDNVAEYCHCLPCLPTRGNVIYTLQSPKCGYVAGENVIVSGQIENGTSKPMKIITAKLTRRITYREELKAKANAKKKADGADGFKSKLEEQILETKIERCNVPARSSKDFAFSFDIPAVVSTIRSSRLLAVEYFVTVWGDTGTCNRGGVAALNIIVGNVPLFLGSSSLPPRKFVDGEDAQSWTVDMEPVFTYQVPYYGH